MESQLAAALDLLHKKSEEISELRIQVNMLRSTEHGKEATGVQTDRDNEAYKDWDLERTRWAEEKLALQRGAETLRGEKERAIADVDFFRAQYQRASDFASSTRLENEELSARAALAESQATKGVALVRATFEGRVSKLEGEVEKYKVLSEMLTERARRTDDDVRYRAALAPEFERDFRQLEGRFSELEAELEETKDELFDEKRANSKLRRKVARLESQEQAADVGQSTGQEQDPMLWSDEKDDGDYNPSRSPSPSPREDSDGSSLQPQRQEDHTPPNEDDARPADGEIEQLDSFGLGESAQSSNDDMVYLCRWRPGEPAGNCDTVVSTKEVNDPARWACAMGLSVLTRFRNYISICCLTTLPAIETLPFSMRCSVSYGGTPLINGTVKSSIKSSAEMTMISIGKLDQSSHDDAKSWPCGSPGHTLVLRVTKQSFGAHAHCFGL